MMEFRLPRIRCAICEKEVDRVVCRDSADLRAMEIIAYCHGDKDTMRLHEEFLQGDVEALHQIMAEGGTAFATKRIGNDG